MLQLTRDGEYAVRAMLYLASQPDGSISIVNEISREQGIPKSYLSKILHRLTKAGLVGSRRGAKGGFALARPANQVTLRETIEAVVGPICLNICLIKKGECPKDAECPVHPVWKEAQRKLFEVLDSKTMEELLRDAREIKSERSERLIESRKRVKLRTTEKKFPIS